jgi:hypothetical protein
LYIKRFEREYTDIVSFMQFNDFQTKVDLMNEILLGYVEETIGEDEPETETTPPGAGGTPPPAKPAPEGGGGSGQNDEGSDADA